MESNSIKGRRKKKNKEKTKEKQHMKIIRHRAIDKLEEMFTPKTRRNLTIHDDEWNSNL